MKERTNTKSVAPRKVKGTVLFTVVCVMMVLIVFLMGALALAATANNRAMKNYNEAQTQATAKAGVRAMVSALKNDVSVASAIGSLTKGQKIELDKEKGVNDIQIGFYDGDTENRKMGEITNAKIEYVGNKVVWDENKLQEKAVICFSATAKQGQAESTVSVYMLRGVNGNAPSNSGGGGGGFVSTGNTEAGNHTSAFGGTFVGFDKTAKGHFKLGNPNVCEAPVMINGDMTLGESGSGKLAVVTLPGEGITVWGDLTVARSESSIALTSELATSTKLDGMSYTKIPYIYVDKTFTINDMKDEAGKRIGNPDTPLNIFCGSMKTGAGCDAIYLYADVYCYDPAETSTLGGETPNPYAPAYPNKTNNVKLQAWTANILRYGKAAASYSAGNFYTKGSLNIGGQNNTKEMHGDVYVGKDFTVSNSGKGAEIWGNLYVGGNLKVEGSDTLKVHGNVYMRDPSKMSGTVTNTAGSAITATSITEENFNKAFPPEYEKDVILGLKKPDGTDTKEKNIDGTDKMENGHVVRDTTYKIISTVDDIMQNKVNPDDFPRDYPHCSDADRAAGKETDEMRSIREALEKADSQKEATCGTITDHCYLKGTLSGSGKTLTIKPAENQTLWVIINDTLTLDAGAQLIMDDSAKNSKVNIVMKADIKVTADATAAKGGSITTKSMKALLSDSSKKGFQINTTGSILAPAEYTNIDPIPLTIYCEETGHKIFLENNPLVVANVKAPTVTFETPAGGKKLDLFTYSGIKAYYNGFDLTKGVTEVESMYIGCIGCCIVKDFKGNNDWEVLYVPESSGGSPTPTPVEEDALMQGWKTLYYENY